MGLFKKTLSVEEIAKAIAALSEEDKEKVIATLQSTTDEQTSEQNDGTENASATQNECDNALDTATEDTEDGATSDNVADSTDDAEEPAIENADESTEDGTDETNTDDSEEHHDEVIQALTARIEALESRVAEYAEIIGSIADLNSSDGPLGASAQADVGAADDALSEDDKIMRKYNPNWRRG